MLNKKNIKSIISFGIIVLGLFNYLNAQSEFFIPHAGYSLQLQNKKDLLFSIGGIEENESTYKRNSQVQIGYSPIKHLGISIFHNRYNSGRNKSIRHNSSITGINIGTYYVLKYHLRRPKKRLPISTRKYQRILFDCSMGYSHGQLQNNYLAYTHNFTGEKFEDAMVKLNLQKFYLQGGIRFIFWNFLHLSGIYRLGKVDYYKGKIDGQDFRDNESSINQILNKQLMSFNEISIKVEIKRKAFGLYIQTTGGFVKTMNNDVGIYDAGLTIDISAIRSFFFKKKRQKESKNKYH